VFAPFVLRVVTTRLVVAAATGTTIPILVILAYLRWRSMAQGELTTWCNGAGLTSMFIVFALWVIQATRWALLSINHDFGGWATSPFIPTACTQLSGDACTLTTGGAPLLALFEKWLSTAAGTVDSTRPVVGSSASGPSSHSLVPARFLPWHTPENCSNAKVPATTHPQQPQVMKCRSPAP